MAETPSTPHAPICIKEDRVLSFKVHISHHFAFKGPVPERNPHSPFTFFNTQQINFLTEQQIDFGSFIEGLFVTEHNKLMNLTEHNKLIKQQQKNTLPYNSTTTNSTSPLPSSKVSHSHRRPQLPSPTTNPRASNPCINHENQKTFQIELKMKTNPNPIMSLPPSKVLLLSPAATNTSYSLELTHTSTSK